jgi:hypothetical protein
VEEEKESMDGEFQESEFIDEEFQHEGIEDEDPLQRFVDWDSPPTYDDDVNEEDPIEELLASNLEEEYEEYGLRPIFDCLYPNKDDQLEQEEPTDDIADYEEDDIAEYEAIDEDFSGEVPNFNGQESDYVDFLGIEDILNSPNYDVGKFYADDENYMFIRETTTDPFLSIFMARGKENEQKKRGKSEELPSGENRMNSRTDSLQLRENDANRLSNSKRPFGWM